MADELTDIELDEMDPDDEVGGDAGAHPEFEFPTILVGPATAGQINSIEEWIRPIACWRLDDTRFEFDSSFVKPGAARELKILAEVRDDNPGATLSIFGQADPSGLDEYNKGLSGRRARAIYGMLIRDAEIWEKLFQKDPKVSGDKWGEESLATMLATVGRDPAEANGGMTPDGRKELYLQYMEKLCGPKLKLDPAKDFLARNADTENHRGDVQGCGEFNAILRFSKKEDAEFNQPKNKAKRNSENAPNRRVVAYLFDPALVIDPDEWPCPASTQGTAKCRKRLFVDHEKRRAPQENRREFAKDRNTFECRFYHRLALESPCEESVLTSLQKVRVRLRLLYRDPMGQERVFPKGYRVTAICPDGASRVAKVGDDGRVRLLIDRPRHSFTLDFTNSDDIYFAAAAPGSSATPADKMVLESDLEAALKEGFRVFKVPHGWSLRESDWPTVDSPLFDRTKSEFSGFEAEGVNIGTRENPVKMVLDPHWQYLRFFYFDRFATATVACLPMMMEGFELADLALGAPDTRSNWTTDKNGNQALPWIRRDRNRPDKDVLLQWNLEGKRTFIETKPDKSRRLVTVDEGGGPDTIKKAVVDQPSIDRLRFYDLPITWKSRGYFARLSPKTGDAFEKMADKPTSDAQPLMFSLDDIVLTDNVRDPVPWNPTKDRVAIFSNKLYQGVSAGLFRPDPGTPYLSLTPTLVTDRNYLADYPDWTRLVIMGGNFYDVFDRRTLDSTKDVVGARAGVQWIDLTARGGPPNSVVPGPATAPTAASATVTRVQNFFSQNHPNRGLIGRSDWAILRCCDVVNGEEIGVNLHYFRFHFDFNPAPIPARQTQPTTIAPPGAAFTNTGLQNLITRWNGPDPGFNKAFAELITGPTGPKLRVPIIWFAQGFPQPLTVAFVPAQVQFTVDIFKKVRAFMNANNGRGALEESENKPSSSGSFTLAHETGHADSLEDEYIETSNHASYFELGFEDFIPGSPYFTDENAIMKGNKAVRARHYWHAAEWLRSLYGTPFLVQHDGFTYKLPPHPNAPDKTFVSDPWREARKTQPAFGPAGFFDAYLFRLGKDHFSFKVLDKGPWDGLLSIVVRMKCTFFHNVHSDLVDQVSKIRRGIEDRLKGKFFITGDVGGEHFARCRLEFSPRFLVTNDSGDAKYHAKVGVSATKTYAQVVQGIDNAFGKHYDVRINDKGATLLRTSGAGAGSLDFNMKDKDLEDDFANYFAGMLGLPTDDKALDRPASWLAVAKTVIPNAQVFALPK